MRFFRSLLVDHDFMQFSKSYEDYLSWESSTPRCGKEEQAQVQGKILSIAETASKFHFNEKC